MQDLLWDDVRVFLAVSRARTVGLAAKQLGVNASTVSRRLVLLERALGATLFERSRDGVTATQAAEDLVPVAEEIEATMARLLHAAEGFERVASGLVRIACPPDVAEVVLVPFVPELRAKHPQLQLELLPGEQLLDLGRREADLALRTVRPTRGDLVVAKLATARWVLAAAPALAKRIGALKAWGAAPWVGWGERLGHVPPARWMQVHAKEATVAARTDSLTLQVALARAGVGMVLVPHLSLAHYGLSPVKLGPKLRDAASAWPSDDLFLVTHRALRNVPRVRAVWDLLTAKLTA